MFCVLGNTVKSGEWFPLQWSWFPSPISQFSLKLLVTWSLFDVHNSYCWQQATVVLGSYPELCFIWFLWQHDLRRATSLGNCGGPFRVPNAGASLPVPAPPARKPVIYLLIIIIIIIVITFYVQRVIQATRKMSQMITVLTNYYDDHISYGMAKYDIRLMITQ